MLRICFAIDFNTKSRCAMRSMLTLKTFTDIHRASLKNKNLRLKIEGWRLKIRLKIFGTGHGAVISWKCYNSGEINITVVTAQKLFYLKTFLQRFEFSCNHFQAIIFCVNSQKKYTFIKAKTSWQKIMKHNY